MTTPRRNLLTPAERAALLGFPTSDDELIQHCTCSEPDLSVIRQGHSGQIRLGIAVVRPALSRLCSADRCGAARMLAEHLGRKLRIEP